jgi:hypothetical protein
MTDDPITPEKIDQLLQFLPLFEVPEHSYVRPPARSEAATETELPYPHYCEDAPAFFLLAGQPC